MLQNHSSIAFFQIVNTNFELRNRRRVTRQADNANSPNFSGDIIVRDVRGNVTERTASYVIPRQALLIAQRSNPNFTGQFSVLYFAQNFFSSDLNISQVSLYHFFLKLILTLIFF